MKVRPFPEDGSPFGAVQFIYCGSLPVLKTLKFTDSPTLTICFSCGWQSISAIGVGDGVGVIVGYGVLDGFGVGVAVGVGVGVCVG